MMSRGEFIQIYTVTKLRKFKTIIFLVSNRMECERGTPKLIYAYQIEDFMARYETDF